MILAAEEVDFEITADYFGKYIWHGQNLSEDPVFQPGLSASYKGLAAAIHSTLKVIISSSVSVIRKVFNENL